MTRQRFDQILRALVGLKFPPASTDGHWEILQRESEEDLIAGTRVSLATRSCFPVPYELRGDIAAARLERQANVPPDRVVRDKPLAKPVVLGTLPTGKPIVATHIHEYHCVACNDLGWVDYWCGTGHSSRPWVDRRDCNRLGDHGSHEWATRCYCADTNPVVQARKARQLQKAADRTSGRDAA